MILKDMKFYVSYMTFKKVWTENIFLFQIYVIHHPKIFFFSESPETSKKIFKGENSTSIFKYIYCYWNTGPFSKKQKIWLVEKLVSCPILLHLWILLKVTISIFAFKCFILISLINCFDFMDEQIYEDLEGFFHIRDFNSIQYFFIYGIYLI